jgi:hypothetical protein
MGDASGDILAIEPTVDPDRLGKRFDERIGLLSKPTGPGLPTAAG